MGAWLLALGRSFRYAGQGIARAVKTGRNLRIHLTAACYTAALSALAGLDGARWAAVLLCCGAVVGAELFNTALECLCDAVHPQRHPLIGAAKDAAAGAVLALALASVGVAAAVFGPWIAGGGLLSALSARPWISPVFALSLVPAVLFVVRPWGRREKTNE